MTDLMTDRTTNRTTNRTTDRPVDLFKQFELVEQEKLEDMPGTPDTTNSGEDSDYTEACYICGCSDQIREEDGVQVCIECGSELGAVIQNGVETKYSGSQETSRCNSTDHPLLCQSNFATGIANSYGYGGGGGGPGCLSRISAWQNVPYREKTLIQAFNKMNQACQVGHLSSAIAQYAHILFKMIIDQQEAMRKLSEESGIEDQDQYRRVKKRPALMSACIYFSCRHHNVNRTHREIAKMIGLEERTVTNGCKLYFQIMKNQKQSLSKNITTYQHFITRFGNQLGLAATQIEQVRKLADRAVKLGVLTENPASVATGCFYLAAVIYNFKLSKELIAQQCQVSTVTIGKTYNKLVKHLELLLK